MHVMTELFEEGDLLRERLLHSADEYLDYVRLITMTISVPMCESTCRTPTLAARTCLVDGPCSSQV